jgi:hypothetical protein
MALAGVRKLGAVNTFSGIPIQESILARLLLVGLVIASIVVYHHTVLIENQANHIQSEIIRTREANSVMQAELAARKSLPVIEKKAQGLGMTPVENYQYITLEKAALVQLAQPTSFSVRIPIRQVEPPVGF